MKSYKPKEVEFNLENKTLKYENGDLFLASRNFNRKFFNSSCCFLRNLLEKLSRAKNWNSYQSFVNRKIASWNLILKLWGEIEIAALNILHEIIFVYFLAGDL